MSHDRSISITAETQQHLIQKKDGLNDRISKAEAELSNVYAEEKSTLGNHPMTAALDEISMLKGQVAELEDLLSNAHIVEDTPIGIVAVGSRIRISMCHCGSTPEELELLVNGTCECGDASTLVVLPDSPVGAAVIGAKVGDECKCTTPKGDTIIVIVSILA